MISSAFPAPLGGSARFELIAQVGQGSGGTVYEAFDRDSQTRVALKFLRTRDPEALLLLKHEFRAIQDLSHPNLVTPKELIEENGQWFFSMEFVSGVDFLAHVRPRELDEARLRHALGQLVVGLCALHSDYKVHRDIKPSNVLVTPEGRVRILDFGIVSDLTQHTGSDDGAPVGTLDYMAPEQATGERVGPEADWYAVGVMLYEALTGQLPFAGGIDVLERKLQTEPPPARSLVPGVAEDLNLLTVELLRTDPAQRPDGFELLARLGLSAQQTDRNRAPMFVGRTGELAALDAAFGRARASGSVTVLVEGESGVGKSWLIREFTSQAEMRNAALVFRGRCYERESVPYKGVDSVVDDLARHLSTLPAAELAALLPEGAAALSTLFPVLDTVPGLSATGPAVSEVKNPQETRARILALLRTLFANLARQRALIVVIDDLQWAGADSLLLLADLVRPPEAPPLLLLASIRSGTERSRNEGFRAALRDLPGELLWQRLGPLPQTDARELIRRIAEGHGDGEALDVDAIASEAQGYPLFIDELVRHRSLHRGAERASLDAALAERAAMLPPAARRLLEAVAVAGAPISQQVMAHATALDAAELFDSLGALRAARFVATSSAFRHATVEPYHDRVREAVTHGLAPATRADWHARIAVALERADAPDPEKLVTHWLGAGETARAAAAAQRAADEAAAALAFDHAASLYRTTIELGVHDAHALFALKAKLADALANAGNEAAAGEVRLELAAARTGLDALDQQRRAAEHFLRSGEYERGVLLLRNVLAQVGLAFPQAPLFVVASLLFFRLWLRVRGLSFSARDPATLPVRALTRIDMLRSAGQGLSMQDNIRGAYFQTRSLLLALEAGDPARLIRALSFEACFTAVGGTHTRARTQELLGSTRALADKLGTPEATALAEIAYGFGEFFIGHWMPAVEALTRGEALFRDHCVGVLWELGSLRTLLYRALGYVGAFKELAARVGPVFRETEKRGDRHSSILLRTTGRAILGLAEGEPERVARELGEAHEWLGTQRFLVPHYYGMTAETQLHLYTGDGVRAHARLEQTWPALKRSLILRMQGARTFSLGCRGRAALAAAAEAPATRATLLREVERTIAQLERDPTPWSNADALVLRAGLSAQRGERGVGTAFERAAQAYDDIDMRLYAVAARRRMAELASNDARIQAADLEMRQENVRDPEAFARVLAPPSSVLR